MEGKKKTDWMKFLTLALCVLLLIVNFWQGKRLEHLESRISEAQMNIMADIRSVESTVYSQLQEMDRLVQSWNYTPSVNMEKRCLDLEVSAVLKEWREDTAADLLWIGDGGTVGEGSAPLSGDGKGNFTGVLEIPLDRGLLEFGLNLVTRDGEGQRRENLGVVYGTDELLPVRCFGWGSGGPDYTRYADKNGTLTVTGSEVNLTGFEGRPALPQLSGQVFRLRRNGNVAVEKTAMYGETIGQYTCEELSSEARIGDEIILTFFCRDESGLGYEFYLYGWSIDEGGISERVDKEADWPALTWD